MPSCGKGGNVLEMRGWGTGITVYVTGGSVDPKPWRLPQSSQDKYNQRVLTLVL